jgi:hypothetical protein
MRCRPTACVAGEPCRLPHRGPEPGDALFGRCHLVGRTDKREDWRHDPRQRRRRVVPEDLCAEVPNRLVLEHELQPFQLVVRHTRRVELLGSALQAAATTDYRPKTVTVLM